MVFQCKMCGGEIQFNLGDTVGICDACGRKQTLPRLNGERRINMYQRANHYLRSNDFDKAAGIYEQILNEDTSDAEAYWSLVLCKYGVEYVEDPVTKRRVLTVNRTQYSSIFDDENYKEALKNADSLQKSLYEEEANVINEIQKGILEISQKEEPFDVFICYKETDANGRRTPDSVLANDLYHQLTQEGFKVFFSRITLEDKLGTAYEPYIFAALNSAKVMVVLGTKPEYFNAVWVRNEWSRFLSIANQSGGKKVLIPAYRDMDPYDLPTEFSHLQAQDMSKLGFMQDLIRGIGKIVKADAPRKATKEYTHIVGNTSVSPLLKRVFLFLEDGNWKDADAYCEKILDMEPENAQAYLGKLLAEMHVRRQEDLVDCDMPFETSSNYQKIVRFGDEKLVSVLNEYISLRKDRKTRLQFEQVYIKAIESLNQADSEAAFKAAEELFRKASGYKNADELAAQCANKADACRKDNLYAVAKQHMNKGSLPGYKTAIGIFEKISGWKDADECRNECEQMAHEMEEKEEFERMESERKSVEIQMARKKSARKRVRIAVILFSIVVVCVVSAFVAVKIIIPKYKFNKAMERLEAKDYETAYRLFKETGNDDKIVESKNTRACEYLDVGDYENAYKLLEEIGRNNKVTESKYSRAVELLKAEKYDLAYALLEEIGRNDLIESSVHERANELINSGDFETAYRLLTRIQDYSAIESSKYSRAMELINSADYDAAYALLEEIGKYIIVASSKYDRAVKLMDSGDYEAASVLLQGLEYKDSVSRLNQIKLNKQLNSMIAAEEGDYVFFGSYEQDNNLSNGKEGIEWLVVEKRKGQILLLSKYTLDCQLFSQNESRVTWETSALRKWLNESFLHTAFNEEEKNVLINANIPAHDNYDYGTDAGNDTIDKVFLLSQTEAIYEGYFRFLCADGSDKGRYYQAKGTPYCISKDAKKDDNGNCIWWLRTPGDVTNSAVCVNSDGRIVSDGYYTYVTGITVRPAIWVNIGS